MPSLRPFLLVLLLPATLAVAQSSQRPAAAQMRPAAVANVAQKPAIDQNQLVQRRLQLLGKRNRMLESRVNTLEEALRDMRARTEFTCSGNVSMNGHGKSDDCAPFACNHLDGRCRTTAAKTEHCAAGFVWDGGSRCVAPPPPAPDDDCGFLGLGCL